VTSPLELTAAFLDWYNATSLLPGPDGPGETIIVGDAPYHLSPAQTAELRTMLAVSSGIHRANLASREDPAMADQPASRVQIHLRNEQQEPETQASRVEVSLRAEPKPRVLGLGDKHRTKH